MNRLSAAALILAAVSMAPSALAAQAPAASAGQPTKPSDNPTRIICEKVEQIGTRIGSKRVCMTAAEWAEQRRQNREVVEHAQQTRCQSLDPNMGAGNTC
jgi:hypothetical protein